MRVTTYVINKGTPTQYFGLKNTENNQILHYAPNNWKTEKGALNWAIKRGYEIADNKDSMSYQEFLNDIDSYVGKVVEFTSRFKIDGKIFKSERYVWDRKEFGEPKADALVEVLEVKVIRDGKLNTGVKGIVGVS